MEINQDETETTCTLDKVQLVIKFIIYSSTEEYLLFTHFLKRALDRRNNKHLWERVLDLKELRSFGELDMKQWINSSLLFSSA